MVVAGVCGTSRLQRELWWWYRVYAVRRGYSVSCGGGGGCMRAAAFHSYSICYFLKECIGKNLHVSGTSI